MSIDLTTWRLEGTEYHHPDLPFALEGDDEGGWTAYCDYMGLSELGLDAKDAMEMLLEHMREQGMLLQAAIYGGEKLLRAGP